jgi:hypothetical protein
MFQGRYRAATHKLGHRDDATLGEISVRCVASVVAQREPFQAERADPGDAVLQRYSNQEVYGSLLTLHTVPT